MLNASVEAICPLPFSKEMVTFNMRVIPATGDPQALERLSWTRLYFTLLPEDSLPAQATLILIPCLVHAIFLSLLFALPMYFLTVTSDVQLLILRVLEKVNICKPSCCFQAGERKIDMSACSGACFQIRTVVFTFHMTMSCLRSWASLKGVIHVHATLYVIVLFLYPKILMARGDTIYLTFRCYKNRFVYVEQRLRLTETLWEFFFKLALKRFHPSCHFITVEANFFGRHATN